MRYDRRELPQSSYQRDGILYIQNVQPEDAGRYSCQTIDPSSGRVIFQAHVELTIAGKQISDPLVEAVYYSQPSNKIYVAC